jgi:hypothetical protein
VLLVSLPRRLGHGDRLPLVADGDLGLAFPLALLGFRWPGVESKDATESGAGQEAQGIAARR